MGLNQFQLSTPVVHKVYGQAEAKVVPSPSLVGVEVEGGVEVGVEVEVEVISVEVISARLFYFCGGVGGGGWGWCGEIRINAKLSQS